MPWELEDLDAPGPARVLPIEAIDEDPDQPRREFDATTLQELAETIKARGVRQPVSVRPHPSAPGRWILNFGARRLRASKLAGKTEIPVFVDRELDSYDQVIENEQRDALRPLELAMFIERQLACGQNRAQIARGIGKSAPYVTLACALVDAPDWLLQVYRGGRCGGLFELYELRRLHALAPPAVEAWLAGDEAVNRGSLQRLKDRLTPPSEQVPVPPVEDSTLGPTGAPASSIGQPGVKPLKDLAIAHGSPRSAGGLTPPERTLLSDKAGAVLASVERLVDALKASAEPGDAATLRAVQRQLVLLARR